MIDHFRIVSSPRMANHLSSSPPSPGGRRISHLVSGSEGVRLDMMTGLFES